MNMPDRRLNAFRPDLADARLRGTVEAASYVEGRPARVSAPVLDLRSAPDAGLDTQLLLGDEVTVFEETDGIAWVQSSRDGYVGYAQAAGLSAADDAPSHTVTVPRTFAYAAPDMKTKALAALSLGSRVRVAGRETTRGTDYAVLADGRSVVAGHLEPADVAVEDPVAIAEMLERTPYLWGGASAFGVDCSGLVQLAMRMAGRKAPRDTDMQAAGLGTPLRTGEDLAGLRRGDLVFWKGHVAIMTDEAGIIHASGHAMAVAREPLREAVDRIAYLYGKPTAFRRP